MKKLFNVCLIVFVLFSQLASFPYNQVKAETLTGDSLFDTVEMKDATNHIIDEAKNPNNLIKIGSTIQVEYAWSIKDQQVAQEKDSTVLQIPNALKVKNDQQGNLMADQQIIGQYFVTANDNKMKIVFNDSVKDSKGVKGKIKFDTVFNPDLKPGIKAVPLTFPLGTVAKTISVPVQVDNPTSPTINSDDAKQTTEEQKNGDAQQPTEQPKDGETQQKPAEQPKDGNTQQPAEQPKNGNPQQPTEQPKDGGTQQPTENPGDNTTGQPVENPDPSPKQIKENILTSVKLTDKDGKPFNDTDNRPNPDSAANIDFTWEVLESLKVKKGDYYIFQLPEYFIVHNTITQPLVDGTGHEIGTFVVDLNGKVTMTFNEYVEDNPNIDGHLKVGTEFNKTKIKGTTEQKFLSQLKNKTLLSSLISNLM